MKTIETQLGRVTKSLSSAGIENPRHEAEFLISAVLRQSRARLLLNRKVLWQSSHSPLLARWVKQRLLRKPFAYIVGEQPFGDLSLRVTRDVLVPRPETELLVEEAKRVLAQVKRAITVVDVGTGSGNIVISLAGHIQCAKGIGIDISRAALNVARLNARKGAGLAPIEWRHGHLLEPIQSSDQPVGLVTANLPYIKTAEIRTLAPELHWEPIVALDGGPDGLRLIRPCIDQAARVLMPGGALLLEIGSTQAPSVRRWLQKSRLWSAVTMIKDYARLPRIIKAVRKG